MCMTKCLNFYIIFYNIISFKNTNHFTYVLHIKMCPTNIKHIFSRNSNNFLKFNKNNIYFKII